MLKTVEQFISKRSQDLTAKYTVVLIVLTILFSWPCVYLYKKNEAQELVDSLKSDICQSVKLGDSYRLRRLSSSLTKELLVSFEIYSPSGYSIAGSKPSSVSVFDGKIEDKIFTGNDICAVLSISFRVEKIHFMYFGLIVSAIFIFFGKMMHTAFGNQGKEISEPIIRLREAISNQEPGKNPEDILFPFEELNQTYGSFKRLSERMLDYQNRLVTAEKSSAIANMSQMIAHDLRLPIRIFRNLADSHNSEEMWSMKDQLATSIFRIENLVEGLRNLDPDRIVKPKISNFPIERLSGELRAYAKSIGYELVLSNRISGKIYIDSSKFERALINLTHNAIDAAKSSIEIEIYSLNESTLIVDVLDDGPGIPTNLVDRIFTKGFTTKKNGTGLGLAYVHHVIKGHGGTIEYDRDEFKSRFQIRIPGGIVQRSDLTTDGNVPSNFESKTDKNILILVDIQDEKIQEKVIDKILKVEGCLIVGQNSETCNAVISDNRSTILSNIENPQINQLNIPDQELDQKIFLLIRSAQQKAGVKNDKLIQFPSS